MSKLEDEIQYIIRDKENKELYTNEVFLSASGAKNSYRHSEQRYNWRRHSEENRFDAQDKYELVKVKLVAADE
jgi:hypothetical protein